MSEAGLVSGVRKVRRFRPASEKIEIVQLTLRPGASVAEVARAYGINANQLFKWRRAFQRGELSESSRGLIPVRICNAAEPSGDMERTASAACGSIHIEFPGRALISVESGVDPTLLRSILESLVK